MISQVLVVWVSLDQIDQFESQTLNLGSLILQGHVDFLDLLFDENELLVGEVSVLRTELVQVELLLLSSGGLHFALLLVDGHVEDLVEVWNSLQDPRLDDVEHDGILEFHSQLITQSLLLPRPLLIVLEDCRVAGDDVIQGNGIVLIQQLNLDIVDLLGKHGALVLDLRHLGPHDVEECDWHLATRIDIDLVLRDEGSMIDDTAPVESLDDELDTVVHGRVDFDHSVLDDLHDVGSVIDLEDFRALVELGEGHREDDLVNGFLRNTLKIIDGLEDAFQEDLEIVIVPDCSFHQLFLEERISFEQVLDLGLGNLAKRGVVRRCDGCRSLGIVDESDLTEDVTGIQRPHVFRLVTHFVFVIDLDSAFTAFNEEHEIVFTLRIVLFDDSCLRFLKLNLGPAHDVIQEVHTLWCQHFLLDDFIVEILHLVFLIVDLFDILDDLRVFEDLRKHVILVDGCEEDILTNILGESGTDVAHKVFHFLLLCLVFIDRHQVFPDIILNVVRNLKTMHCSVSIVQTFLEIDVLLVHFLD